MLLFGWVAVARRALLCSVLSFDSAPLDKTIRRSTSTPVRKYIYIMATNVTQAKEKVDDLNKIIAAVGDDAESMKALQRRLKAAKADLNEARYDYVYRMSERVNEYGLRVAFGIVFILLAGFYVTSCDIYAAKREMRYRLDDLWRVARNPTRDFPFEQLGGMFGSLNRSYSDLVMSVDSVHMSLDDFKVGAILLVIITFVIISIVAIIFAVMMRDLLRTQRRTERRILDLTEKLARAAQQYAESSSSEKQVPTNNPSAEKESSAASCTIDTSSQAAQ